MDHEGLQGAWVTEAEAALPSARFGAEARRVLELGLQAAPSIQDRSISLFARGNTQSFMGPNTFLSAPYDLSDLTALLGVRAVFYTLAGLVGAGKLGRR